MPYCLASLVWLSPLWAWGIVAAVGLPVLAHFLSRRRYRPVEFPALRFVMAAASRAAAVDRPRHLLLLILRALALLAVVAAFMRPVWRTEAAVGGDLGSAGDGQTLVILLDASASMQRVSQGRSAFEQARAQADRMVAELEPGKDRAMVFLITDRARPLLSEPTGNLTLLRDRLASARCTWQADDPSALAQAMEATRGLGPARAVWITDGQRADAASQLPLANLALLTVGQPLDNTAIHLVDAGPYPPVAGQPMTVTVRLRHFGTLSTRARFEIRSGDQTTSRAVPLDPGEDRLVSLPLEFAPDEPGWITVAMKQSDAFAADDSAGLFVQPVAGRPVLCLTKSDQPEPGKRIGAMLAPRVSDPAGKPITPNMISFSTPAAVQRSGGQWDPSTVLVISGLDRPLTESTRERLVAHVQAGGGIVWFADTPASRETINLMPGPLLFGSAGAEPTLVDQTRIDFDQNELEMFEGPARDLLARIVWPGVHPATRSSNSASLIAAAATPIVVSQSLGRGRLCVINADPFDPAHELSLDPAFVVLVNELVRLAAPGPALPESLRPGDPLPGEWEGRAILDVETETHLVATTATSPGALAAMEQGQTIEGRWVELDLEESDLTSRGAIPSGDAGPAESGAVASWAALPADKTRPLWPYALLVGMFLLSAEAMLLAMDRRGGAA